MNKLKRIFASIIHKITNKENVNSETLSIESSSSSSINTTLTSSPLFYDRSLQNFRLIWVSSNIDEINYNDSIKMVEKLRHVINTLTKFTNPDKCLDFIANIKDEQIFLISPETLAQTIVPVIHDAPQIKCIYIFGQNKTRHEQRTEHWPKIKGFYTDIDSICKAVTDAANDCDPNSVAISFVKKTDGVSKLDLNTLDCSFMYTQILKEILLTIDFQQVHIDNFLMYCRDQFVDNDIEIWNIEKIAREYHDHQPIWWYTYNCFLFSMLNRALRTMEIGLIIKMGFFLKDLHAHILQLHSEQFHIHHHSESFIVYRGQSLSQNDFNELKQTQSGLLSFNSFLSTSKNRTISLNFARRTINTSDLVGVLFIIEIDPTMCATPFASVKNVSYYKGEEEILFSMHSVFRIGQIQQIDGNDRLWQVELTLTSDNDPQLRCLTKRIQEETERSTGWFRLGILMTKVAKYDEAEQLYNMLLSQTTDEREQGNIYYQLGLIMYFRGEYRNAIPIYEKSLELREKVLSSEHRDVADCYNDIGLVYYNMGEYSKALSSHENAFKIYQKSLPINHSQLATSYNNTGLVYKRMNDHSKALSCYENALKIFEKVLPANHPNLAISYNNIGQVYNDMGEYEKALSYYGKALEIRQKTLLPNHPDLATSYGSIGLVYKSMGQYLKALSYYKKALEIRQQTLPANHPDLAISYNNIGLVYKNMENYSEALSYYEKALEIRQKSLPTNHPDLATSYDSIGSVYYDTGEYSKALSYYEKALEIRQETLSEDHLDLAMSYNNIGSVYRDISHYRKALSYYQQALDIFQRSLHSNHFHIKNVKKNIKFVKKKIVLRMFLLDRK